MKDLYDCSVAGQRLWLCVLLVLFNSQAFSGKLTIEPRLSLNEIVSDNINLRNTRKNNEYITQTIPGLFIKAEGSRINADADYVYESLNYAKDASLDSHFTRLNANARGEIIADHAFLNAAGSIRQRLDNNDRRFLVDNINPGNRSDVTNYSLGTDLNFNLGPFVSTIVKYNYGVVDFENEDDVRDAVANDLDINVHNKSRSDLEWRINYSLKGVTRRNDDDVKYVRINGEVSHQTFDKLALLLRAGFVNDDVRTLDKIRNDGYTLGGGFIWKPSSYLTLDATYGRNRKLANLVIRPDPRSSLRARYQDTDIGNNPGGVWGVTLDHRTRRTTWRVSYDEDSTNSQFLTFAGGRPAIVDIGGSTVNTNNNVFRSTNEDFIKKTLIANFNYSSKKSIFRVNASNEKRNFLETRADEQAYGGNGSWEWTLTAYTKSLISGGWIKRQDSVGDLDDTFWFSTISIIKQTKKRVTASIEFRHTERDASVSTDDYIENRVSIGLTLKL